MNLEIEDERATLTLSSSETDASDRPVGVKSALRVLAILEHFAQSRRPATLAQLCRNLDMPKSSCFALLETLRQAGYLYWLGRDNGYYPTRRWRDLGDAVSASDPILVVTSRTLNEISAESGETTILAKRDGLEVFYLAVAEPEHVLRFAAHTGQRKSIHSAASGRALIGLMPQDERAALLTRLEMQYYSPLTPVTSQTVEAAVQAGNDRGFHVSIGEHQPDTTAIAVAFRWGTEAYALVVGAPSYRVAERIGEIGALLARHARSLVQRS